jgi:Acylphosphatases
VSETVGSILTVAHERVDMSKRTRAHVFVSGTVQGVSFRATTRDTARQHGVEGWVRNLNDGRVEAVFEGPGDDVDALVEFCHEGSSAARVEDVDVTDKEPQGESGFRVRW